MQIIKKKKVKTKEKLEHEHRYYDKPFMKQPSKTCLICDFNPHFENYGKR